MWPFLYIFWGHFTAFTINFQPAVHRVQYRLAGGIKMKFWNFFLFLNCFRLLVDPQNNNMPLFLYFWCLEALNFTLKLVIRHDELENMNHGVLCDTHVKISGTQIIFHWIGLKKLACKHVQHSFVCALTPGGINPPPQFDENRVKSLGQVLYFSLVYIWQTTPAPNVVSVTELTQFCHPRRGFWRPFL